MPQVIRRRLADAVALGVFVKHVVAMLDAITLLVRDGACLAGQLQLRSMIEASLYGQWILKADSERRALCYYVWNLRRQEMWTLMLIDRFEQAGRTDTTKERGIVSDLESALGRPSFAAINAEFDEVRKRKKKKWDPSWHEVAGSPSLRQISIDLDRLSEWEVYYAHGSEVTHASSYSEHLSFPEPGLAMLTPIRGPGDVRRLVRSALRPAFETYRYALAHYRSGEMPALEAKLVQWAYGAESVPVVTTEPIPRRR